MTSASKISSSQNHFVDTNVLLRHANNTAGEFANDIATILADAVGASPKRRLWISSVLFAELRPSTFVPGKFATLDEFAKYLRSIAEVVDPNPTVMLRAARLRDMKWQRDPKLLSKGELPRIMTLGDAIHIASALFVKEAYPVDDLEFLTFDNKADSSVETGPGAKSLPLLSIGNFVHNISSNPDVFAVLSLPIVKPALRQSTMGV